MTGSEHFRFYIYYAHIRLLPTHPHLASADFIRL